jgi:hypothetical protein
MNFYYIFLLLLVVLSAYSESPQQGEPPDSLDSPSVAVCPNSSSDPLGVLAPILPQSWVFGPVLPQNMVLPQNEVPNSWVFASVLPQNEVFGSVLQNGVFKIVLPQNGVFGVVLSQTEMNITVLPQNWVFNNVPTANCPIE